MRADIRARSVPFFLLVVLAIFLSPGLSAALSIDVTVLPDATVGIPYSYTVPVSGATQAFLCGAQNRSSCRWASLWDLSDPPALSAGHTRTRPARSVL